MKKKIKIAVLAVLVIALAVAAYLLLNDKTPGETDETTEDVGFTVSQISADIGEIYLDNSEASFHFIKKDGLWLVKFNEETATYGNTIIGIESILKTTMAEDKIEENVSSLAKYGLDAPAATVKYVLSDGSEKILLIGDSVVGEKYYFTLGDGTVYTMKASEAGLMLAGMRAFVNLTLTEYKIDDINSVIINKDSGVVTVGRKQSSEIVANTADSLFSFALRTPVTASASPDDVEKLYNAVTSIGADSYLPNKADSECGFEGKYFEVATANASEKFLLGAASENGYHYMKKVGMPGVFSVSDDALVFMDITPFELVDKHISLYYFDEVSRIVIESAKGNYDITCGDKCSINDKEIDKDKLQTYFQDLISLSYDGNTSQGKEPGASEVTVSFYTSTGVDTAHYCAYDAMSYAVVKDGVRGFTIQKKFIEKILNLAKELK